MIDYEEQQNAIKEYIKTNYPKVLEEMGLPDVDAYIDDYLDLDTYQKSKQLFSILVHILMTIFQMNQKMNH